MHQIQCSGNKLKAKPSSPGHVGKLKAKVWLTQVDSDFVCGLASLLASNLFR